MEHLFSPVTYRSVSKFERFDFMYVVASYIRFIQIKTTMIKNGDGKKREKSEYKLSSFNESLT